MSLLKRIDAFIDWLQEHHAWFGVVIMGAVLTFLMLRYHPMDWKLWSVYGLFLTGNAALVGRALAKDTPDA